MVGTELILHQLSADEPFHKFLLLAERSDGNFGITNYRCGSDDVGVRYGVAKAAVTCCL